MATPPVYDTCSVYGCLNTLSDNITFFPLPEDDDKLKEWSLLIGREDILRKDSHERYRVCAIHFAPEMLHCDELSPDALPLLHLPITCDSSESHKTKDGPSKCFIDVDNIMISSTSYDTTSNSPINTQELSKVSASTQTPLILTYADNQDLNLVPANNTGTIKRRKQANHAFKVKKAKLPAENESEPKTTHTKIDVLLKLQQEINGKRNKKELKLYALNLYFSSPQLYWFLEKIISLPSANALQTMKINFKSGVSDDIITLLSQRLQNQPQTYKYCTINLEEIELRRSLFYDITSDEIIGFHEIDGRKLKEIANNAFAMLLNGCIESYKQPLGYAFTGINKNDSDLSSWLDATIRKLHDAGFVVCAVVSSQSTNFVSFADSIGITPEHPYFTIDDKRVYFIFDVPHLFNSIRDIFLSCNFLYDGNKLACWEHIEAFYKRDKLREIKMAPKLTDGHLNPNRFNRLKVRYTAQVLSYSVAAGMSRDIESGELTAEAVETVDFIIKIDQLFDVLNSIKNANKYKLTFSNAYQIECLETCLETFKDIKAVKSATGEDMVNIPVFSGLQMTIKAILLLIEDFKLKGLKFLTKRINLDENMMDPIRMQAGNSRELTPIIFKRLFSKLAVSYLFQDPLKNYDEDLDETLLFQTVLESNYLFIDQILLRKLSTICVQTTDYRMGLPPRDAFKYVCWYLLKKCSEKHKCPTFNRYIRSEGVKDDQILCVQLGNLVMPPKGFVNYLKVLEKLFLKNFEETALEIGTGRSLLNIFDSVEFQKPCNCFPLEYLKKLFVRMRIYYAIKFTNRTIN